MREKHDNFDAMCSILAGVADAGAVFFGFMAAVWIRFRSGWIALHDENILPPRIMYLVAAYALTILALFIFRQIDLYKRPQFGRFEDKIPRLIRGVTITILSALALSAIARPSFDWPPYSRWVVFIAFFTVMLFVLVERYALFRLERHWAHRSAPVNRTLIIGTDKLALRLHSALEREPRFRARIAGYLLPDHGADSPVIHVDVPSMDILGRLDDFEKIIVERQIDDVILCDTDIPRERLVRLLLYCERHLIPFRMVPDLYGVLTSRVRAEHIEKIPLIGLAAWPLDAFGNRVLKRLEDITGALVGLTLSAPILAIAAILIKRSSPGPVFYRQTRCGLGGEPFTMYKLRTMRTDAEQTTGPVWTVENDPRRTRTGEFLRKWNLDELPQFWNVLLGHMSLVGPRPERPFFVDQFKADVGHYMTRHVSKPGMTGWAQINGLRGNTDIHERIQYDLYYLENWSLSLDLKILLGTFFANKNAY